MVRPGQRLLADVRTLRRSPGGGADAPGAGGGGAHVDISGSSPSARPYQEDAGTSGIGAVGRACPHIESGLAGPLGVKDVAHEVGISTPHRIGCSGTPVR